jgi:fructosamine-3-kinase
MIPGELKAALQIEFQAAVTADQPVFGGDINQAARVSLADGRAVFVKWNRSASGDFFAAEAHGLRTLAAAGAVRVPEVYAVGKNPPFLAMEWIDTERGYASDDFAEALGRQMALLHQTTAGQHGLDADNYIGSLPQSNTPSASWVAFFRDRRIGAQMDIARQRGRLPKEREALLTRLQSWLDVFLDDQVIRPSLLHGDLWSGNYMITRDGQPVVIDPAAYYGHREVDLAMTELFGGFPSRFYAAYHEVYPLEGYEQRRELYQLYPLLVHMNLFGGGYAARVDAIARHYVG